MYGQYCTATDDPVSTCGPDDVVWLAANTATTRDGDLYYTRCPRCGSNDLDYDLRARNHSHDWRSHCFGCGWSEWLPDIDDDIMARIVVFVGEGVLA